MEAQLYSDIMELITPYLVNGGAIAFTLAMVEVLVSLLINAATGRGFRM